MVLIDGPIQLVLMYLSKNCPLDDVTSNLDRILKRDFITIVTGDFNFEPSNENSLTKLLANKEFDQVQNQPTHDKGGKLDQCYVPSNIKNKIQLMTHSPYYSDHDALCINVEI